MQRHPYDLHWQGQYFVIFLGECKLVICNLHMLISQHILWLCFISYENHFVVINYADIFFVVYFFIFW